MEKSGGVRRGKEVIGDRCVSGSSRALPAALSAPTQEIFFTPMIVLNAKAIACGAKI